MSTPEPPRGTGPGAAPQAPPAGTDPRSAEAAPRTTATSPTGRAVWTRSRGLLIAAAVLLLFGVGYAVLHSAEHRGRLDPRSADPTGGLALARLLADRGVTVDVATTTAEAAARTGPGTTLLVTRPDLLAPSQQDTLRSAAADGGTTVLIAPTASLGGLAPGVEETGEVPVEAREPGCSHAPALRAGDADLGGVTYRSAAAGARGCYHDDGDASLLLLAPDAGRAPGASTVVVGTDLFLHNARLADHGNASLALQLLGEHPRLVWYLPSPGDVLVPPAEEKSFFDLVPDGWLLATAQLGVAAVLAALWRARRLGPVVTEPLPVVVRAAETTEGRARLYRRAGARGRAADAIRRAARERIAPLVGVAPLSAHDPAVLVPAVTARTGGAPGAHGPSGASRPPVDAVLFGPAPHDDAALTRLADELDALERQVREQ